MIQCINQVYTVREETAVVCEGCHRRVCEIDREAGAVGSLLWLCGKRHGNHGGLADVLGVEPWVEAGVGEGEAACRVGLEERSDKVLACGGAASVCYARPHLGRTRKADACLREGRGSKGKEACSWAVCNGG